MQQCYTGPCRVNDRHVHTQKIKTWILPGWKQGVFGALFALFILNPFRSRSQDIHFSHIHASPTLINPALTGLFNGQVRFAANYRSQWQSFDKGYQTMAGAADMKLVGLGRKDVLAGGLQLFSDKAGDLNFRTNSAALSFSVLKALDRRGTNVVSLGIQNAFTNQSLNYANIIAFDEEPAIAAGATNSIGYWDVSAGLSWFSAIDKNSYFYLGAAMFHINRPLVSFLEREKNVTDASLLERRLVLHGGADIKLGRYSTVKPSVLYMNQGPHQEITMGRWHFTSAHGCDTRSERMDLTAMP